jgi:hypothetical protein
LRTAHTLLRAGGRHSPAFEEVQKVARTLKQAWERVALAGRELGSGPFEVLSRFPQIYEELVSFGLMSGERTESLALGIVVGLVQADDPATIEELRKINREWLEGHH